MVIHYVKYKDQINNSFAAMLENVNYLKMTYLIKWLDFILFYLHSFEVKNYWI